MLARPIKHLGGESAAVCRVARLLPRACHIGRLGMWPVAAAPGASPDSKRIGIGRGKETGHPGARENIEISGSWRTRPAG